MLQHESHAAPDGQQVTVRHRVMPEITYTGRSTATFGDTITVSSSAVDEAAVLIHVLSLQSRTGCQFGGVWVAASAQSSPGDLGCTIPASKIGYVQVVVSDLHSRWPLPLANFTAEAVDVPSSGRFALTLRASPVVEMIVPTAGMPVVRRNTGNIDVYGQHLVPEMPLLASFCAKLTTSPHKYTHGGQEEVRLNCLVALSTGKKLESTRSFVTGFNAVIIAVGHEYSPRFEVQYLLQNPPQIIATTSSTVYTGDVLTVVGDHFVVAANPLSCITGPSMDPVDVVSSAVARCVVSGGNHVPTSVLHRSSSAGQFGVGIISGETVQSLSNLVSITWLGQPPRVGVLIPNVGLSHGGTQVTIFPQKGGVGAARFRSSIHCRFGTIAPISGSHMSVDAIACTSPALSPGKVSVGVPAPGLFHNAAEFSVLDGPSMLVTVSTALTSSHKGTAAFFLSTSVPVSQVSFKCVLSSLPEALIAAYPGAGGRSSCSLPTLQPGFGTLDMAVTRVGTPQNGKKYPDFKKSSRHLSAVPMPHLDHSASVPSTVLGRVHHNAEIQMIPPAPMVFVQRHRHSSETYPGDPVFLIASAGGFDGEYGCMVTVGSSSSNFGAVESSIVQMTIVSSAVALCEIPAVRVHKEGLLIEAMLHSCISHACGSTIALTSSQDRAHLAVGTGGNTVVGMSPSWGSSVGGTQVRVQHQGVSLDSSRQYSVCRMGSIWPISASMALIGNVVELLCVSPAHLPGVVSVATGKGLGWVDDLVLTFTFVEAADNNTYSSQAAGMLRNDVGTLSSDASITSSHCDGIPLAACDISSIKPSWGTAQGGTEMSLSLDVATMIECKALRASCRVGTIWPVVGYLLSQGLGCVSPAHVPRSVDVTAPMMVSGTGQPFTYLNDPLLSALDVSAARSKSHDEGVLFKSSPKASMPGGLIDGTTAGAAMETHVCVFASRIRSPSAWKFIASAHVISSTVLRCETPVGVVIFGVSIVKHSRVESSTFSQIPFSTCGEASSCRVLDISPSTSTSGGGRITGVKSSCQASELLMNIDARVGCRFGSLGPITASAGDGKIHDLNCVAPAHIPGTVSFALTSNWRDVSFELFGSEQVRRFVFISDKIGQTAFQELPPPGHQTQISLPLLSNLEPWLVWGGSVLHITGRELPSGLSAACLVGSSLVAAVPVSSALVLCDPFPVMSSFDRSVATSQLGGGMEKTSISVMSSDSLPIDSAGIEATPLNMFVILQAPVVDLDVVDGWEQGGGRVTVELGGWAPAGLMDCHFGTVAVHGREGGGASWQGHAAASRRMGAWWSEATSTTDVECLTPARKSGSVPIGVSLAHSPSASFGDVNYKYL